MFAAFAKAFAQLSDPKLMRVIVAGVIATIVIYAAAIALLVWALSQAWVRDLPVYGMLTAWGAGFGAVILATLLFPGIVSAVMGLWLEQVADAVEARHYSYLAPPRSVPIMESVRASLRLAGLAIGLNVVLLPLYIVLFFIPPLNIALYYAVNGRLLGREYFESVAARRLDQDGLMAFRQEHRRTLWITGAVIAFMLTVPFLNMVAPVIGAAAMTHVFQKLTARG